jgi:hypothetical protein
MGVGDLRFEENHVNCNQTLKPLFFVVGKTYCEMLTQDKAIH